jgi:hypothetical protein
MTLYSIRTVLDALDLQPVADIFRFTQPQSEIPNLIQAHVLAQQLDGRDLIEPYLISARSAHSNDERLTKCPTPAGRWLPSGKRSHSPCGHERHTAGQSENRPALQRFRTYQNAAFSS